MSLWILASVMAALLGLQLVADARRSQAGVWLTKPLASAVFLVAAWQAGAPGSTYGLLIFVGLSLSWCGDVLLIPRDGPWFLLGLVAFLLGHVAYAAAFWVAGAALPWTGLALVGLALLGWLVFRWLRPHLGRMKIPVIAYITVISSMVALAMGTLAAGRSPWLLAGALAFYASDLAVARNRFVAPGIANRLWGLPLYYGAQLILAATVAFPLP